ncbi:OLC1v1031442C1 [Oldenlandia corymbosa var. corymbosa]|uniref:OLC1v1031442C1 n=1 Tax=Oldenlandia corymbosa var. corymbosa TaxID=529605 RepID=A0AAV1CJA5_OLDCO|nr:OLC1v1031442C1 [Oldenlandia corymbosa var. corymbosa]
MASSSRKRPKTQNPRHYSSSSSVLSGSSIVEILRFVAVLSIAAFVAIFCNYVVTFFNQQPPPFCDSDLAFDESFSDSCEPCPSNGICKEGKFECADGYRKQGKLCVEDRDINRAAEKLSEFAEAHVCEGYSQYLCSGAGTIWVGKDDLSTFLDNHHMMEAHGLDESAYALSKFRAIETVDKLMEKRVNAGGFEEFKCPDLIVKRYKSLSCSVRNCISEHFVVLLPVCALLVGSIMVLSKALKRHRLSVRAEEIYNKVCDVLEEKAAISRRIDGDGEPWVVASWLRDYLLSPKERRDPLLWRRVEDLVQEDSRLDRYPKMVKGEARIVWEWQVEGTLSSSGKKKRQENELKSNRLKNQTPGEQSWEFKNSMLLNS